MATCFEKETEIAIKSKETSSYVAIYLRKRLLATYSTGSIDYYLCLFMQTQFQLSTYVVTSMYAQMKHIL